MDLLPLGRTTSPPTVAYWRRLLGEVRRIHLPRTWVNRDQRAIERAVRMAATVSSGASKGTKCPAPGTNRKSRLGKVCSIPSAQDGGLIGSSSPHLTTVGMSMGESRRVLLVG